jgi:2-methylcitrate dehydratase PrpD
MNPQRWSVAGEREPFLFRSAVWAAGLQFRELPARVVESARWQTASCLGALYAGLATASGRAAARADLGMGVGGPCTLIPEGAAPMARAAHAHACLSMALDYDDYLPMGHTGHSAVWVALAAAEAHGRSLGEAIAAQVAANEIAGRLGAAVLVGPHNGQLWSHIHLAGAACAAGLLAGLDPKRLAHAMAIALYQPTWALAPGFMGPSSKVATAATPVAAGIAAASLAAEGIEGPLDLVEHPQGYLQALSFAPLSGFLTGLGEAWLTDALAFKIYPGCAYVDAPLDALFDALAAFGRPVDPEEVAEIDVRATLLTVGMDRMARPVLADGRLSPMGVNFSLPYTLALALCAGRLTGAELADDRFAELAPRARDLAGRVRLCVDWPASLDLLEALDDAVGLCAALRGVGGGLGRAVRHLGRHGLGARDLRGLGGALAPRLRRLLARFRGPHTLSGRDLARAEMPFSARVRVRLVGGDSREAVARVPRGAPGRPRAETAALVREKLVREAAGVLGAGAARGLAEAVFGLRADAPAAALLAAASVDPGRPRSRGGSADAPAAALLAAAAGKTSDSP